MREEDTARAAEEIASAARLLVGVMRSGVIFKVGRCRESEAAHLHETRPEYGDCAVKPPRVLWKGPRDLVDVLETALINAGWTTDRSLNERPGGGDVSEEQTHVVYVVEWKPTPCSLVVRSC